MSCPIRKIDSNVTGLAYAEEECLQQLPTTPDWYELEPNSYSDFGGETSLVMREPIEPSRQKKKGTVSDLDASGGFNSDLTQSNLTRLLQGFFFADAREKAKSAPFNGTQITLNGVSAIGSVYGAVSGMDVFSVGSLVLASNYGNAENNGLKTVATVSASEITVSETLVDEPSPPSNTSIETVGFQFATGDLDITVAADAVTLTTTVADFTTMDLNVGEWIFVGGDAAANQFVNNSPGYARIRSIAANALVLDDTTWTPVTEANTTSDMQIFFGTVIRNEKTASLIKRRSYNLERTLGEDANGTQSEYLEGAIPNEFTVNIPTTDKINADLTFVAMDNTQRDGTTGVKSGNRIEAPGEEAFNTSSDIFRTKLSIFDADNINASALFAYVSEATIAVNNGITPNKAIGTVGSFDATAADFEVTGSLTAYFTTIAAVQAVRNNNDVQFNVIAAQNNAATVMDIPLLSLGGGRVTVEKDSPITIPLDKMAAECPAGYTLLTSWLAYVPTVGMPT